MDATADDNLPPRLLTYKALSRRMRLQAIDYVQLVAHPGALLHQQTRELRRALLVTSEAMDRLRDEEPPLLQAR